MWRIAILLGLFASAVAFAAEPTVLRMMAGPSWGIPPKEAADPRSQARRAVFEEFRRQNPDIVVMNSGGIELKGELGESGFLMSMAGDTAPDVMYVNFRQYYNYIDQGFCQPLDDLVQKDVTFEANINPIIEKVLRSYDGKLYAMPWYQVANALYYRKDHFAEAGLDPSKPPKNWDEFYEYGKRLVESKSGRVAFMFGATTAGRAYPWSNFVWQAGGDIVAPAEGGRWKTVVDSPEGIKALDFYRKMVLDTWKGRDGKQHGPMAGTSATFKDDIKNGVVSMWFAYTSDVLLFTSDLNPSLIGVAAMPAGPGGHANEINAGMWAISSLVKDPKKLDACWRFIKFFMSDQAAIITANKYVELGMGSMVNPEVLRKAGYSDLSASVDPSYIEANKNLFQTGHPEPYGRNCQQVYVVLDSALDRARLEPNVPSAKILRDISKEMDRKLLGYTPPSLLAKQRGWAMGIFGLIAIAIVAFAIFAIRNFRAASKDVLPMNARARRNRWLIALCLAPAALTILVWAYYPLLRGLMIAFQDYRIIGGSKWTGTDNFISVFTQPIFYKSLWNSFVFVGLSLLIGFFLPIFLALALNEIPRFKTFFRTIYYLPAMTSPIIIAFLWRQFYDKSEQGLLNVVLRPFIEFINPILNFLHIAPVNATHDWLGDPSLAMFAVVLPGIWAGAGPGSILYLAALKNIPAERYEAADLDGASWWKKIRFITLPSLTPLMLINLLGVFIAGFKAMENVFVLTGGGPLYATHTIGLEVWTNAFMFLKFGYATAAAWVMGAILVGFTVIQIRHLTKMRFTTARL